MGMTGISHHVSEVNKYTEAWPEKKAHILAVMTDRNTEKFDIRGLVQADKA